MKILIIYDSYFKNTEKVAYEVKSALMQEHETEVVRIGDFNVSQLHAIQLLIVGSPTRAFRPTPQISTLIKSLPDNCLCGVNVAAFDTRISALDINNKFFNIMARLFGYAAEPIAKGLVKKGGNLVAPAEGFYVTGTEGPLKDGELARAQKWAGNLIIKLSNQ